MPIMNMKIQKFLLNEFLIKLFDGHLRLTALWYLLNDNNYKPYLSEHIMENIKLPLSYLHCELFYGDINSYRLIEGLYDVTNDYNFLLGSLAKQIQNTSKRKFLIFSLFENVIHINDRIASIWLKIMPKLFNLTSVERSEVLGFFLKDIKPEDINSLDKNYYSEKEIYTNMFDSISDKQKLIYFMQIKTNEYYKEFSKYLTLK